MEEHLGSQKSFIPHIDFNRFASVRWLVDILFELVVQIVFAVLGLLLLVKLFVLLHDIFANVSILFFHYLGYLLSVLGWYWFFSVSELG